MSDIALSLQQLQLCRNIARQGGDPVAALAEQTGLAPQHVLQALATQLRFVVIDYAEMMGCTVAFALLPLSKAQQRNCLLLHTADGRLLGVLCNPFDADLRSWLDSRTSQPISYRLSSTADLHAMLTQAEAGASAFDQLQLDDAAHGPALEREIEQVSLSVHADASSPAVRLLNSTLYDALKAAASDIHLESMPGGMTIKYRIDGVLDAATEIRGRSLAEQVVSRLKVLAELDIAERRVPQDGSFRVEASGREIDLRVSIMPSIHGEDAVIRILDKQAMVAEHGALTLDALGFDPAALAVLRQMVSEPYGMVLVTGPTGSGKTTTLYGAISEINHGRDKIITIEDPVEYQLKGVLQIPVNDKKGLTFARGLRSILRHDPDKIMVGEIRDTDTAEIAVQSALTGHLVLTTVHANNVFDVFGRFAHMGIDPYAFVSALNGIWAQRLLRLNCSHCSETASPSAAELQAHGLQPDSVNHDRFLRGRGCGECRGSGYRGRKAVAEYLTLSDELRELIVDKRPIRQIKDVAYRQGTQSLHQAALALVARGETTLEEVRRVTLLA